MNDCERPRAEDKAPQPTSSKSSSFLLESNFLGPQGVRAGWRAALYVALFLLLISVAAMLGGLLHIAAFGQNGTITPSVLATQEGLAAICALAAALILARLERRPVADYGTPLAQALGKKLLLGALWGIAVVSTLI